MGRKRLPEGEKKVNIKLSIKKELYDELKSKDINVSQLFEQFVKDLLKR